MHAFAFPEVISLTAVQVADPVVKLMQNLEPWKRLLINHDWEIFVDLMLG